MTLQMFVMYNLPKSSRFWLRSATCLHLPMVNLCQFAFKKIAELNNNERYIDSGRWSVGKSWKQKVDSGQEKDERGWRAVVAC